MFIPDVIDIDEKIIECKNLIYKDLEKIDNTEGIEHNKAKIYYLEIAISQLERVENEIEEGINNTLILKDSFEYIHSIMFKRKHKNKFDELENNIKILKLNQNTCVEVINELKELLERIKENDNI
jgi:hypothetical protein